MKVPFNRDCFCGKTRIPKGDYWVSLKSEASEILLSAQGKDIRLPALRRRTKVNGKTTQVSFYSGGGTTWTLVVSAPKYGEWVVFIELEMKQE
jgi:hypothetical protein